eukprot:scaffold1911_cov397-Prasinococcus_capsulatus_cf.AAC.24
MTALDTEIALSYFYVALWISLSASVILYNKWILAYYGFRFPLALTMWHMLFCSVVGFLAVKVFKVTKSLGMTAEQYARRVLPIGALYAASLWFSNSAYLYLTVAFIQMLKAMMPVTVYTMGVCLKTETYLGMILLNMIVISVGVAIASYGELNFNLWQVPVQQRAGRAGAGECHPYRGHAAGPGGDLAQVSGPCDECHDLPLLHLPVLLRLPQHSLFVSGPVLPEPAVMRVWPAAPLGPPANQPLLVWNWWCTASSSSHSCKAQPTGTLVCPSSSVTPWWLSG